MCRDSVSGAGEVQALHTPVGEGQGDNGHDEQPDDCARTLWYAVAYQTAGCVVDQTDEDRTRFPRRGELSDPGECCSEQALDEEHERE